MSNPTGKLHRFRALEVEASALRAQGGDSDELLELEFAFASETPVERYFGSEILEVTPKAARLDRVAQGVCPVLENHWSDRVVGRVLEVRIAGGVARCRVRFSRSELARGVVQDVVDGIRQAVSFGYRVHRMELVESGDEGDTYRVTDWELFEVTIAAIPADPTIGVHRAADEPDLTPLLEAARSGRQEGSRMTISNAQLAELEDDEFEARIAKWPEAKQAGAREARRRILIENLCREFRAENELRDQALREGWETQRVIEAIRDERARTGRALPVSPDPDRFALRGAPTYSVRDRYGLDEHDVPRSNILTDSRAYLEGRHREIGPTIELSDHLRASDGRKDWPGAFTYHASTFYRSAFQGLAQRTISKVSEHDRRGAGWCRSHGRELDRQLPRRLLLGRLLIQIFAGLVSDVAFRRMRIPATAWVDENAGSGESSPSFTSVTMTPHTCRGGSTSRAESWNQASPAAAQITEAELRRRSRRRSTSRASPALQDGGRARGHPRGVGRGKRHLRRDEWGDRAADVPRSRLGRSRHEFPDERDWLRHDDDDARAAPGQADRPRKRALRLARDRRPERGARRGRACSRATTCQEPQGPERTSTP
ncbi:MAG: HK97 family phage prohead protease [Spirochaetaceae bacterium]|nr:HK97 family phage prohead protease [Spirochaetaceae bacterium]